MIGRRLAPRPGAILAALAVLFLAGCYQPPPRITIDEIEPDTYLATVPIQSYRGNWHAFYRPYTTQEARIVAERQAETFCSTADLEHVVLAADYIDRHVDYIFRCRRIHQTAPTLRTRIFQAPEPG